MRAVIIHVYADGIIQKWWGNLIMQQKMFVIEAMLFRKVEEMGSSAFKKYG
jgi:hypothetical protein